MAGKERKEGGKLRLFIGTPVEIPFYHRIQRELGGIVEGKWVEGYNLHLTHLFIGEDFPEKWQIELPVPTGEIEVRGFGVLGNRILYLRAHHPEIGEVNRYLVERFNWPDRREFIPHITLCRVKKVNRWGELYTRLDRLSHLSWRVPFTLYLYSSQLTRTGPIYKKIWRYR
jgi:2'-5' RNA ligase